MLESENVRDPGRIGLPGHGRCSCWVEYFGWLLPGAGVLCVPASPGRAEASQISDRPPAAHTRRTPPGVRQIVCDGAAWCDWIWL